MKKSILICGLALVGFTSCKKTWTCDCTGTILGTSSEYSMSIVDQRKSDAKTICTTFEKNMSGLYANYGSYTCELK